MLAYVPRPSAYNHVLTAEYIVVQAGHGHAQSRRAEETPELREGGFSEIGSDGNGGEQREARLLRDRKRQRRRRAAEVRLQGRRELPSHHNYASVTSSSSSSALLCSDSCALTFHT